MDESTTLLLIMAVVVGLPAVASLALVVGVMRGSKAPPPQDGGR
jgi:hypothetical protein